MRISAALTSLPTVGGSAHADSVVDITGLSSPTSDPAGSTVLITGHGALCVAREVVFTVYDTIPVKVLRRTLRERGIARWWCFIGAGQEGEREERDIDEVLHGDDCPVGTRSRQDTLWSARPSQKSLHRVFMSRVQVEQLVVARGLPPKPCQLAFGVTPVPGRHALGEH